MATLNIKNFPDKLHRQLKEQAAREHRSVAQQVIHLLAVYLHSKEPHSIRELRGLGKEAWSGIDAAEHIDNERGGSAGDRYRGVTETLDRVYANEPSELDPGLAQLQSEALGPGEW